MPANVHKGDYFFLGNCISLSMSLLAPLMETEIEITKRTFRERTGKPKHIVSDYGDDYDIMTDRYTTYHRGRNDYGVYFYFLRWSLIEYVYCPNRDYSENFTYLNIGGK